MLSLPYIISLLRVQDIDALLPLEYYPHTSRIGYYCLTSIATSNESFPNNLLQPADNVVTAAQYLYHGIETDQLVPVGMRLCQNFATLAGFIEYSDWSAPFSVPAANCMAESYKYHMGLITEDPLAIVPTPYKFNNTNISEFSCSQQIIYSNDTDFNFNNSNLSLSMDSPIVKNNKGFLSSLWDRLFHIDESAMTDANGDLLTPTQLMGKRADGVISSP